MTGADFLDDGPEVQQIILRVELDLEAELLLLLEVKLLLELSERQDELLLSLDVQVAVQMKGEVRGALVHPEEVHEQVCGDHDHSGRLHLVEALHLA